MQQQIHNRKKLKPRRKSLRNNATSAETELWTMLRGKQLDGRKFRRQHSVGYYILDFYCPSEKLAIELDGAHHFTEAGKIHDNTRTVPRGIKHKNYPVRKRRDFPKPESSSCGD